MKSGPASPTPRLRRVLGLRDLIFYGIVLVMPIAPVPMFGVAQVLSHGHFVTTILIAMVAMMLTAVSYGRMASLFPTAGSAYTYVGRGLNPHLGFLTGWSMFLDYLIQPLMNGGYGALTIQRFFPFIPYAVLAAIFVTIMTLLNLRGIRVPAFANIVLVIIIVRGHRGIHRLGRALSFPSARMAWSSAKELLEGKSLREVFTKYGVL